MHSCDKQSNYVVKCTIKNKRIHTRACEKKKIIIIMKRSRFGERKIIEKKRFSLSLSYEAVLHIYAFRNRALMHRPAAAAPHFRNMRDVLFDGSRH